MTEARESGSSTVRSWHLLAGLLRVEEGVAAIVLAERGVTLQRGRSARTASERADRRFRVHIDDTSDRSIYEQIVAQVTEAIANSGPANACRPCGS